MRTIVDAITLEYLYTPVRYVNPEVHTFRYVVIPVYFQY